MKNRIIALVVAIFLLLFSSFLHAQITFERWYDITTVDRGSSVDQTFDGGYIITGETIESGIHDIYLMKTDSLGNILWQQTYGGPFSERAASVKQLNDYGFVVVGTTRSFGAGGSDVYVIRTDSIGDTIWTRTYGDTSYDHGHNIIQTNDCFLIVGFTGSYGLNGDIYVLKIDSLGDTIWTKAYGGIAQDGGWDIVETPDGGFIIAGYTLSFGGWLANVYIVKIDSLGDTLWTKAYGGNDNDEGFSITKAIDGGYVISGYTESFGAGEVDFYLLKINSVGDTLWTRTYGGSLSDFGSKVIQSSEGNGYLISGSSESFGAGGRDVFLVKTNVNGDTLWTRTYGGNFHDGGKAEKVTMDGGYIIVGSTQSFGVDTFDIYLIKTDSEGNVAGIQEQPDQRQKNTNTKLTYHPNPFSSEVRIQVSEVRKTDSNINLQIFDVTGRRVREFILYPSSFILPAKLEWDGRDEAGMVLPPGIYFLKLNGKPVGKVVKVR